MEVELGIRLFKSKLEASGAMKLSGWQRFSDRRVYYFEIALGSKQTDIALSEEFLSDLPATKEYQVAVDDYVRVLEKRMANYSPSDFYSKSGTPFNVEIYWPIERLPNRAANFARTYIRDIRFPSLIAKCAVILPWSVFDKPNPLQREEEIVNTIRLALDRGLVEFFGSEAHPAQLQQLEPAQEGITKSRSSETEVEQFVAGKVYWLGFRREDERTRVWIADPWDADYLGVDIKELTRCAQVLRHRDVLVLDEENEFASAGKALLLAPPQGKPPALPVRQLLFLSSSRPEAQMVRSILREVLPSEVSLLWPSDIETREGISRDIRSAIERADLVVADVAGADPNLMYELGFAHALRKKVAVLLDRQAGAKLPGDLAGTVFLPYDSKDPKELRQALREYMERYVGASRTA